jgi:hypothetical protein
MKKSVLITGKVAGTLFFLVFTLFLYVNLPGPPPRPDVRLGLTFSARYAADLGLDWRETYRALLDEIGVRRLRLPVYWDLIEREKGRTDFEDLDWQIAEAKKRGATLILAIGQRVPRWPECHIPAWAKEDRALREEKLFELASVRPLTRNSWTKR